MIPRQLLRSIHTNYSLYNASKKAMLAKLRKKTGYTFVNCKKALELHDNDMQQAEKWLALQAQEQGWSQAEKLQSRATTQGLIAMLTHKNHGALVEINCETDFVARNKKFHDLADTIVTAVLQQELPFEDNTAITKSIFYADAIKALPAADGKSLNDHSALTIGSVGENIQVRRALRVSTHSDIKLFGCTHPAPINPAPPFFGKYGALIALKCGDDKEVLGTQLCQHIIGMNPTKIGNPKVDEPLDDVDEETIMLYQEFLLDPSISVQTLLQNEQAEIVDFARFEMGEPLPEDRILDSVETCG